MAEAGLDPNQSFGSMVWEQEGPSVQKRYDQPRPGDIVVLHDVKLSGKKTLKSYTQQAGSVEEPMFGICVEFETKNNKVKIWQTEKGVSISDVFYLAITRLFGYYSFNLFKIVGHSRVSFSILFTRLIDSTT